MSSLTPTARLLVVDLDDTLWTWFDAWHQSFSVFLAQLVELSGLSEPELIAAIQPLHRKRGTTEYSWLIDELDLLENAVPEGMSRRDYYDPAVHAQNSARKATTVLYPGVRETLERLQAIGTTVVGYTESLAFWTRWRIERTGLDGLLAELYSSEDHDSPAGVVPRDRRHNPTSDYVLEKTIHKHVPAGETKPNPVILQQIIDEHGVTSAETVYVGDSLMKDVKMAQAVGAIDVLAAYGVRKNDDRYKLLQLVSHWDDATIAREMDERKGVQPTPTLTLRHSLDEIFDHVTFAPTEEQR